jgi:hypothetical protein
MSYGEKAIPPGMESYLLRQLGQREREARANRASEFSFGRGLEPPGLQPTPPYPYALPEDGGRYRGMSPKATAKDYQLAGVEPITVRRGCAGRPLSRSGRSEYWRILRIRSSHAF